METTFSDLAGPESARPSGILHLSEADITLLQARKTKISSGMKTAAVCLLVLIFYRLIFESSDMDLSLVIGFGIFTLIGVGLFWYFYASRVDNTLATGTKNVGRARIARKVISTDHDGNGATRTLILDWDFKEKLSEVYPTNEMFDQVEENELVDIEVATANKLVLRINKLPTETR